MNYLHATPAADGLCRKCGVQLARIGQFGYACVYCEPERFPRPAMSAAADTAELDRLRAENERMRSSIRVTLGWLDHVRARGGTDDNLRLYANTLRNAIKEYP